MKGMTLVALGKAILRGRAAVNEASIVRGPSSRDARAAKARLRDMMDTSKYILDHN